MLHSVFARDDVNVLDSRREAGQLLRLGDGRGALPEPTADPPVQEGLLLRSQHGQGLGRQLRPLPLRGRQ